MEPLLYLVFNKILRPSLTGCGLFGHFRPITGLILVSAHLGCAQVFSQEVNQPNHWQSVLATVEKSFSLQITHHPVGNTLHILYPTGNTIFPPEIVPPKVQWEDDATHSRAWLVVITSDRNSTSLVYQARQKEWMPSAEQWEAIKQMSMEQRTWITILGIDAGHKEVVSRGQVQFMTSRDRVDAAILFREVPLPFVEAVRNPSQIRWRLGKMDAPEGAQTIWQNSPVCANCHSVSQDGRTLAMDFDYPTKGSQLVSDMGPNVALKAENLIQWENASTPPGAKTFGLLSQISPDGNWIISTVQDDYLMWGEGFAFSQFFLPVRGVLAVYHRPTRRFHLLKGADDPNYVQTNPVWSPDGRSILFARARALAPNEIIRGIIPDGNRVLQFLEKRGGFRFELCRLPFNDGQGGKPELLQGASANGRSNFFPKYSPDGRWIVFCQSSNYMFLQPDSELFIVPSSGGKTRRLAANTPLMNSWHSWSPNSRWLVFASKAFSPFTQLFLTHIDEAGESSAPVRLDHLSSADRAANLPEFVSAPYPDHFDLQFAQDESWVSQGNECFASGHADRAMEAYRQAIRINPANIEAHQKLGLLLQHVKSDTNAALVELTEACRLAPKNAYIHHNLGLLHFHSGQLDLALHHLREAVRFINSREDNPYNPYDNRYKWGFFWDSGKSRADLVRSVFLVHMDLVQALFAKGEYGECIQNLELLTQRDGRNFGKAHYLLARAYASTGQLDLSRASLAQARRLSPGMAADPVLLALLGEQSRHSRP